MTTTQQPEALRLAELIEQGNKRSGDSAIAAELRRLHSRVVELESQLEAIGAGGVESLRKKGA